ncbi:MAG TPA: response regulator transcription factor [Vicinamibacterales bacterium]|nr:response regulator transcription factor [Vicinamibacterales bacterium]
MSRVLVVEDEAHIRELIQLHLGLEGLEIEAVGDGHDALARANAHPFDLIILDLMLPGVDGISICRAVRRGGPNQDVPILMLTARREESDKVLGLESGADDYLAKPFGIRELVARARALLRRPRRSQLQAEAVTPGDRPIEIHGLHIDSARRLVRINGEDVDLTAQEFRLLLVLATHPGIVFSREALLTRVWPDHTFVTERSVDSLVKRLRRRIEKDPADPGIILTVWGSGYKCADV